MSILRGKKANLRLHKTVPHENVNANKTSHLWLSYFCTCKSFALNFTRKFFAGRFVTLPLLWRLRFWISCLSLPGTLTSISAAHLGYESDTGDQGTVTITPHQLARFLPLRSDIPVCRVAQIRSFFGFSRPCLFLSNSSRSIASPTVHPKPFHGGNF